MKDDIIAKFGQGLRGILIGRDHPDYDEARKLYNGMIDKRPLLIARCADVADVIAAVKFGRDNNLRIAVRGGGHNGPGLRSCDDGLVIDLSTMKGVRVDPATRTVRVGPGCTSGDVDHATHAFGLAVGEAGLRHYLQLQRPGRGGQEGVGPAPQQAPATLLQLDGRDALPGDAGSVRPILPKRAAMVLERRFREGPARRSDRNLRHRVGEGPERTVPDASLPD
jgi:hypothetical protein